MLKTEQNQPILTAKPVIQYVNFGIFPGGLTLVHDFTLKEFVKEMRKQKCNEWVAGVRHNEKTIEGAKYLALRSNITYKHKEYWLFYIFLNAPFAFTDYDYAVLAHEVLHIIQFHLVDILDRNVEHEAEAYLHTHIMMQCLKALRAEM